jgi:hypothetical protein
MEEEVIDFLHQSVEIVVWLIAYPREHVVDHLLEAVFELCSERQGSRDESLIGSPPFRVRGEPNQPST